MFQHEKEDQVADSKMAASGEKSVPILVKWIGDWHIPSDLERTITHLDKQSGSSSK